MTGLTRRQLLAAPLAFAAPPSGRGEMLWDWMMRELDAADARRRERLRAVRTPGDLAALGGRVRSALLAAIGGFPERTPLNAKVGATLARDGYAIEKIVFESRPRFYVTASLYRPERMSGPRPAVIESCGHYPAGKAAPDYQRACAALAKKGILALIYDPIGQGERSMYGLHDGGTTEHAIAGKPCYLVGRTLAHFRVWDAVRALDYLESRPDVDRTRLGMFGHSGGGMMTLLTAPLERRLRAVMSCCAVTSFYHKTRALLIADPEQIVPGIYREGIDHPELIAATAPRAFLIGAALRDFVPLEGTRRTCDELRSLLPAERFAKMETDNQHVFDLTLREACYGWMLKHLAGEEGDSREPRVPVETAADLRCTASGDVMDLPGARGVFEINRDYARELRENRRPADLRQLLAIPEHPAAEAGIELPQTAAGAGGARLVIVGPRRNAALAAELAKKHAVVQLDLRGWGETTPDMPDRKADFPWEDFFAFRSIEMGRPLLGQRVRDLLAAIAAMPGRVYVVGLEGGALVALHAAALDARIAGVAAIGGPVSYADVLEQKRSAEPVSGFVPGALLHYDLPELAARLGPRPYFAAKSADAGAILEGLRI